MYLCFDGLIGSGKTTLSHAVSQHTGWRVLEEPVETNFMLEPFYRDPAKHAFELQIYLLHERYRLQQIAAYESKPVILDRCLPSDRCFLKMHMKLGNISELQARVYDACFDTMTAIRPPFLLVFLDVAPEVAYQRVLKRARGVESGLTLKYLLDLNEEYMNLLDSIESGRHAWSRGVEVMRIPWGDDKKQIAQTPEFFNLIEKIGQYMKS